MTCLARCFFKQNKSKIEFDVAGDIDFFKVSGTNIWVASGNHINHYEFGAYTTEVGSFDNLTKVNDFILTDALGKTNLAALIASSDNQIKLILDKEMISSVELEDTPTSICKYHRLSNDTNSDLYVFGTLLGGHGMIKVNPKSMELLWYKRTTATSSVTAIKCFDIDLNGQNEILITKENGDLEIFTAGKVSTDSVHLGHFSTKEPITGLDIGRFKDLETSEVVLSSYSGLIMSLFPQSNVKKLTQKQVDKKNASSILADLQEEIAKLEKNLEGKKVEYDKMKLTSQTKVSKNPFKTQYNLILLENQSHHLLTFKFEFPIVG